MAELRATETSAGVNTAAFYENFDAQAAATRKALRANWLHCGPPASAWPLMAPRRREYIDELLRLTAADLEFVADRSPHKHGRLTPGTMCPWWTPTNWQNVRRM